MVRDWRRFFVWLIGALVFVLSYGIMLTASPVNVPDNLGYDMLLGLSGFAATMAGGAGAMLIYDRLRSRNWRR